MIQKKICLIGTSGVGKTSLIARFVHSKFSEKYLTTVGVKIDRKSISLEDRELTLVIWDLAGVDDFQQLTVSYVRGSHGYLLVADGTRAGTLDQALDIRKTVVESIGDVPFVLLLNKADLEPQWQIADGRIASLTASGVTVMRTSARTGEGVEAAFGKLAQMLLR